MKRLLFLRRFALRWNDRRHRRLSQSEAVVYLENGLTYTIITKLYTKLHTGRVYNHTGYDVTIYFLSEVIGVRRTAENDASDLYNLESPNLAHTSVATS